MHFIILLFTEGIKIIMKKKFMLILFGLILIFLVIKVFNGVKNQYEFNNVNTVLTDDETRQYYEKANEIKSWFYGEGPNIDINVSFDTNSAIYFYYKVSEPGVSTMKQLEQAVNNIFDEDIASDLLSFSDKNNIFKEIDGILCRINEDYTINMSGYDVVEENINIINEDSRSVYRVEKGLFDIGENMKLSDTYIFDYELNYVDDKWLFVKFPLIEPFMSLDYDYTDYGSIFEGISEIIDEREIELCYEKAAEAYFWLTSCPDNISDGPYSPLLQIGNIEYGKVYNKIIKTKLDLKNYLRTIFSDDIVEAYMSNAPFIELDGCLYYQFCVFPSRIVSDGGWAEKINDDKYIYNLKIKVEKSDSTDFDCYLKEYVFEHIGGKWVFTQFPSPNRHMPEDELIDCQIDA